MKTIDRKETTAARKRYRTAVKNLAKMCGVVPWNESYSRADKTRSAPKPYRRVVGKRQRLARRKNRG